MPTARFADIVGFPVFSGLPDSEQVKRLVVACFEQMLNEAESHGGVIDKIIGESTDLEWITVGMAGALLAIGDNADETGDQFGQAVTRLVRSSPKVFAADGPEADGAFRVAGRCLHGLGEHDGVAVGDRFVPRP